MTNNMNKRWLAMTAMLMAVVLAACSPSGEESAEEAQAAPPVLATMGEVSVTVPEVQAALGVLGAEQRQALLGNDAQLAARIRGEVLRRYVTTRALAEGWLQKPAVAAMVQKASNQLVYKAFLEDKVSLEPGFPSDSQIQQVYENNKASFLQSGSVHIAQIFLARGVDDGATARSGIEEAKARLEAGESFADLASSLSQHEESAARGGDLGWVAVAKLQPAIRQAITGHKAGDLIGPVESASGWHLLQLEGIKPASYLPLASVSERIRALLRQQGMRQASKAHLDKLLKQNPVQIKIAAFEAALDDMLAGTQPADTLIATMGTEQVTLAELLPGLRQLGTPTLNALRGQRGKSAQLLSSTVIQRFVLRQAVAEGIDKRPEVQQAMAQEKSRLVYASYVRAKAEPPADYPSDEDVSTAFASVSGRLKLGKRYQLSQFSVTQGEGAEQRVQALGEQAAAAKTGTKAAEVFEKMAKEGGQPVKQLLVPENKLLPVVRTALQDAQAGRIVGPVQLSQGWTFLLLRAVEPPRPLTEEEARPLLVRTLRNNQSRENEKTFLSQLVEKTPIQLHQDAMEKLRQS